MVLFQFNGFETKLLKWFVLSTCVDQFNYCILGSYGQILISSKTRRENTLQYVYDEVLHFTMYGGITSTGNTSVSKVRREEQGKKPDKKS